MSDYTTLDLINAIESGKTLECERAFAALVQEKLDAKLEQRTQEIRANMFESEELDEALKPVNHAELAQAAHKAYVQATRQGNGVMAKHYLGQHMKHKAAAAKQVAAAKQKASMKPIKEEDQVSEETVEEGISTMGAMAVGHAISHGKMDHSKISASMNKQKAGHYAQYTGSSPKIPTSLQALPAHKRAMNKARGMVEEIEEELREAVTGRVSFSGKDSSGNEKTIHFGKNNGNPYHVIQGKPGTNFSASAVIKTGAAGNKGAEEHMSKVAELVHSGKHKEALDHLNKNSHIQFKKITV